MVCVEPLAAVPFPVLLRLTNPGEDAVHDDTAFEGQVAFDSLFKAFWQPVLLKVPQDCMLYCRRLHTLIITSFGSGIHM